VVGSEDEVVDEVVPVKRRALVRTCADMVRSEMEG